MTPSIRPTIGMPMARATMVTCAVLEPSSSTTPRSLRAVVLQQVGGTQVARDQDGVVGQLRRVVAARLADQVAQQAVGDVVEVDQPLAQVGVAGVADADPGLLLDPADRGLGREAGADRLADAPQPAGVVGEHAVGLEHLALLAADEVAGRQHLVERLAQLADRPLEPGELGLRALGQQPGDLDARLVQPGPADRHALDQPQRRRGAASRRRRR